MNRVYQIFANGTEMGCFVAASEQGAVELYIRDAGYKNLRDMALSLSRTQQSLAEEIVVEDVREQYDEVLSCMRREIRVHGENASLQTLHGYYEDAFLLGNILRDTDHLCAVDVDSDVAEVFGESGFRVSEEYQDVMIEFVSESDTEEEEAA